MQQLTSCHLPPLTPSGLQRGRWLRGRWLRGLLLSSLLWLSACERSAKTERDEPSSKGQAESSAEPGKNFSEPNHPENDGVFLKGHFQAAAKAITGDVSIEKIGEHFELVLQNIQSEASGPIRIYLVDVPAPKTTRDIDGTERKFDMGELDLEQNVQKISLPVALPADIHSVVLWQPKYRINLAYATLNNN